MLRFEDACDGCCIEGIRAKSIDCLCGQSDETSAAKSFCSLGNCFARIGGIEIGRIQRQAESLHTFIVNFATGTVIYVYSHLTMPIETEIKFRVQDIDALTAKLGKAGFRLDTPRAFESNVLYDWPDRRMRARTEILRIRSYAGRWTLTHKRLPEVGPGEDRHKHRVETETELADGSALAEVFLSLGLVAAFRYEKWRSEWSDGDGHCVVDETPIGSYAELEGSAEWIDDAAARLGLAHSDYITLSYGRLFEQWCREHDSSVNDLTFAVVEAVERGR